MFPRRYFAGRYFAARYWPESEGGSAGGGIQRERFIPISKIRIGI